VVSNRDGNRELLIERPQLTYVSEEKCEEGRKCRIRVCRPAERGVVIDIIFDVALYTEYC